MVAGEARRRANGAAKRFAVRDIRQVDKPMRWNEVWLGNPLIARLGETYDEVIDNGPGNRPYIAAKAAHCWTWREYEPMPANYYVQDGREDELRSLAGGCIVVNPHLKPRASQNKRWPIDRWQAMVDAKPNLPWAQLGTTPMLKRVRHLATLTFREACAVLAGARAIVTHEGGMHHAAAALGVPAVVIFGGFISPRVTGYAQHVNIFTGSAEHPLGCGYRVHCRHCDNAMHDIKANNILDKLLAVLP